MRLQTSPPQRHYSALRPQLWQTDQTDKGRGLGLAARPAWGPGVCTGPCGSATGATLSTGRDGVWVHQSSPIISLLTVEQGARYSKFGRLYGCEHVEAGWSKLLAFPRWAQEPASAGFPASGFVRTHAGLRDLQANDGTPASGSGRRGQAHSGGLRGHAPPVAGGLTEWPLLAKHLLGRKCSHFFPRGSSPVLSISQLSLKLLEISTTGQKILPPAGWWQPQRGAPALHALQGLVTVTPATPPRKGPRTSAPWGICGKHPHWKQCLHQNSGLIQSPQGQKKKKPFLTGDWNAKLGSQEMPRITGKFGPGVQNEAGQRLMEFCPENTLVIVNSLSQQHER